MHARVTRFNGLDPHRIQDTIDEFSSGGLYQQLKEQQGFKSVTVGVNRANGQAVAITLYESEQDMRESERVAAQARAQAAETGTAGPPRTPVVDHYEVVFEG